MDDASLARLVLRSQEKRAGIGSGLAAVGTALGRAAGGVGKTSWKAFRNAPLDVGMGVAPLALFGTAMLGYDANRSADAKKKNRALAQQIGQTTRPAMMGQRTPHYGMVKQMAVSYDIEEVRQASKVRRLLEKQASMGPGRQVANWTTGKVFKAGLALGAAGLAVGLGQQAATTAAGELSNKMRTAGRQKRYNAMLKADPTLKGEQRAKTYFGVIDRTSPFIASEPYILAATVRSMLETPSLVEGGVPSVGPRAIKELMDVQKSRGDTKYPWLATKTPDGGKGSLPSAKDVFGG